MVDQALDDSAPPIAAVILAAGFSRRLGRPKQLVTLGGATLLERAVRAARSARLHTRLRAGPKTAFVASDAMSDLQPA